jgi:hypothetical protein
MTQEQKNRLLKLCDDLEILGIQRVREIDYWKKRCEAAEECYKLLNLSVYHRKEYAEWQQLKNNPPDKEGE